MASIGAAVLQGKGISAFYYLNKIIRLINFGYLLRVLRWSTANFVAGADTVSALVHEACISKKENDGLELAPRTLLMQRPQWTRVCCALRQVRLRLHHFRFALRRNVSVEFDDIS